MLDSSFKIVVVVVFLLILAISGYAGFHQWPLWSLLILSALLATNKVNYKSEQNDVDSAATTLGKYFVRALVNWPIMLVFAGLFYGLGHAIHRYFG